MALFYEIGSVAPGFYDVAAADTKTSYGFQPAGVTRETGALPRGFRIFVRGIRVQRRLRLELLICRIVS